MTTLADDAPTTLEDASPPPYIPALDLRSGATGGGELLETVRADAQRTMGRLLEHVAAGTTDQADDVWREPVVNYLDAERWRREIERVHKQVPLPLAMSCELPTPGSFKAIDVADVPVLITRTRDGGIRAMVNACRHRGSPVAARGTGTANRFTCPYHAWTYDLEGALKGVYGEKTFGELDHERNGLLSLWAEERAGIVFVGLTPGMTHDLGAWLGDLEPLLAGLGLADMHHFSTRELPGTNYKIVLDGYLETYHFASLHATSVNKTNISNLVAFSTWGPHQRNASALRTIAGEAAKAPEERDPAMAVAPNFWLFPGMAVAGAYRHLAAVSIVLPGPTPMTSTTHQIVLMRRPPEAEEERVSAEHTRDWFFDVTMDEDYAAQHEVARSLPALAGTDLQFGRNEPGVQHFHRWLHRLAD